MQDCNWPDDRLCRLVGVRNPIIQAPMAGSSTLAMARAVSKAGGLGSLACATLGLDSLQDLILDVEHGEDGPIGGPINANFLI